MNAAQYRSASKELRGLRASMWTALALEQMGLAKLSIARGDVGRAYGQAATSVGMVANLMQRPTCAPSSFKRGGITSHPIHGGEPIMPNTSTRHKDLFDLLKP